MWAQFDDLIVDSCYFTMQIFDRDAAAALLETPGFVPFFVDEPSYRSRGGARWLHLSPGQYELVKKSQAELFSAWSGGAHIDAVLTQCCFIQLLANLCRLYTDSLINDPEATSPANRGMHFSSREATVAAAVHFIETHFADRISVDQVADAVFLSPAYMRGIFTSIMGRSPRDYLRYMRVEQAKLLLATTDKPITKIGQEVGLGEASYFARTFRAGTGMTPRQFRELKSRAAAR
jgi:AraC-like DNA-binding protein